MINFVEPLVVLLQAYGKMYPDYGLHVGFDSNLANPMKPERESKNVVITKNDKGDTVILLSSNLPIGTCLNLLFDALVTSAPDFSEATGKEIADELKEGYDALMAPLKDNKAPVDVDAVVVEEAPIPEETIQG